ncbi:single-stranded DNA-binding protein [Candidatus Poriferisodalis sp.]|uniref:single-stranded DNA-binding protein n=1 Tax=Candidatus Poriferisodalis sp. TaxID=3101277 RepID=UPI003B02A48A
MADNTITVVGNLTRDPELRFTQTGRARALLGIAVNRRWMNRQTNEWDEQVSFFNIVCWAELAENVSESLAKGNRVVVTGRLEQRSWETQEGEQRNVVEIVADEIAPSLRWATAEITRTPRGPGAESAGARERRPSSPGWDGGDAPAQHAPEEEPF